MKNKLFITIIFLLVLSFLVGCTAKEDKDYSVINSTEKSNQSDSQQTQKVIQEEQDVEESLTVSFEECAKRARTLIDDVLVIVFVGVPSDNENLFVDNFAKAKLEYPRFDTSREVLNSNSRNTIAKETNVHWGYPDQGQDPQKLYGTAFTSMRLETHSVLAEDGKSLFGDINWEYTVTFPEVSNFYPQKAEFLEIGKNENPNLKRGQIRFDTDNVLEITVCELI